LVADQALTCLRLRTDRPVSLAAAPKGTTARLIPGHQNEVVTTLSETVGIDGAHARRCARDHGGAFIR
jgi:hypothetical protein